MKMVKTPNQLQNIIEDWFKIINISLEDLTSKANEKNDVFDFYLQGGPVTSKFNLIKNKDRDDRITISSGMNISPTHLQAMTDLNDKQRAEFVHEINELVILADCQINWQIKDGQPIGFVVNDWVDTEKFERSDFYRKIDKVLQIRGVIVGKFQIKLNPSVSAKDVSSSNTNPMYS